MAKVYATPRSNVRGASRLRTHIAAFLGTALLALPAATASAATSASSASTTASATCAQPIPVRGEGQASGTVCADQLAARGLTAIELGDGWVPYSLGGAASDAGQAPPAYRDTFIELAAEKFAPGSITAEDGALEFFGVSPNFHVVLKRMDDDKRHACHDAVVDDGLAAVSRTLRKIDRITLEADRKALARDRGLLKAAMRKRKLSTPEELAAVSPAYAKLLKNVTTAEQQAAALTAVQGHLACEGLLPAKGVALGQFDHATGKALKAYQLRHWIVGSGELDPDTAAVMREDSRELEFRLALRVLRQRVSDAAGLIEDGSARAEWGTVLGRHLDGPPLRYQGAYAPMPNGAPDLVSAATETAAKALGWRDYASARKALRETLAHEGTRVAIKLPPLPSYHHKGVELRAEIERGEVSYDVPKTKGASRAGAKPERRPVLVVYAKENGKETALVRWPTTIGGWQDEKLANGAVVRRYKPSDTGPRLWRDLVVAPVWYPPNSTPDSELVRARNGKWELKEDLIGPGYRSAYGLAMLVHHMVVSKDGADVLYDRAIRTHGSANYQSITRGDSHGCHRTYNHQILALSSFLLRNHEYAVRGPVQDKYIRKIRHKRSRFVAHSTDRGYTYELTPALRMDVLEGTVVSKRSTPVKSPLYGMR